MQKKYLVFLLIFIFLFSFPVDAENVDLEYIQKLINNQEREKALNLLEKSDISNNPDLRFYKALLLSWKDEFKKSEKILLQLTKKYPARFDFYAQLARLYDWMGKPYKSVKYREKAYEKSKGTKYENNYLQSLKKARVKIEPINFGKIEFLYEKPDQRSVIATNFLLGQERIINDNIDITGSAGFNYKNDNINYLLRAKFELDSFSFLKNLSFKNSNNLTIGDSENSFDTYNNFNYKINGRNSLAFNLNVMFAENKTNYQNINLGYKHKWNKLAGIIGTTSRRDESGWNMDFSQNIEIYYPLNQYLFNFKLNHYDNNEYVFRTGIELTEIKLNSNWVIKNLNSWINDKSSAFFSIKFNKKDR